MLFTSFAWAALVCTTCVTIIKGNYWYISRERASGVGCIAFCEASIVISVAIFWYTTENYSSRLWADTMTQWAFSLIVASEVGSRAL
jgi:hypothetical protein